MLGIVVSSRKIVAAEPNADTHDISNTSKTGVEQQLAREQPNLMILATKIPRSTPVTRNNTQDTSWASAANEALPLFGPNRVA